MIKHKPKTARGFLRYHRILWNAIIREILRLEKNSLPIGSAAFLKERIWPAIFSFPRIPDCCFPCWWKAQNRSNIAYVSCLCNCLLETNAMLCLNSHWNIFCDYCSISNYDNAIKYAKIIRDTPMQKKWKCQ